MLDCNFSFDPRLQLRRNDFRLSLVKRQLQSIKRGTSAASGLAERCRDCQRRAELLGRQMAV